MEVANMKTRSGLLRVGSLAVALIIMTVGVGKMARAAIQTPGAKSDAGHNVKAQVPTYKCSIKVPEPEPADLSTLAKIKADQAMAAARAAFPGTVVKKMELDNENGCLVYSVVLSNGMEVKVDAGNGTILHKELADQEEHEGREGKEEEED
jgi:uncharacterized membrane protein YkoI